MPIHPMQAVNRAMAFGAVVALGIAAGAALECLAVVAAALGNLRERQSRELPRPARHTPPTHPQTRA